MDLRLRSILAGALGLSPERIEQELAQQSDGDWDSLTQMDIVTTLEAEYNFELTFDEIVSMTSVASIVKVVGKKLT